MSEQEAPITSLFRLKQGTYLKPDEMADNPDNDHPYRVYGANGVIGYSNRKMYDSRTILVSCRGANCGVIHFTRPESWISNNSIACVPVSEDVDALFFYYLFLDSSFNGVISGSAQPQITITSLSSKKFIKPPLPIQRKIAAVLSAYDDLIENNARRIAILEEMAAALYREWFVEFRFPGHETVPMVESKLGIVPQGWEVVQLQDILVLQRGFDLPNQLRKEGTVPIYAATGVNGFHNQAKVKGPGVITGRSGSLGVVTYALTDFWPLNTALYIKDFRRVSPIFSFYFLKHFDLKSFNSGAAVPTLNRNDVHTAPVILPDGIVLKKFDAFIEPLLIQLNTLSRQNANLRQTRDLLLPRLISGEVDVSHLDIAGAETDDDKKNH